MTRARPDAGFLLAETLITFALSALVLLGLAASASVLLRATDRSVASVGGADDLGRMLGALTRDLGGLKRARWAGLEPQGFVFRGGPNSLFFAQEVPSAGGGRVLRVVSLREIALGRGTALMRADAALPATAAGWGDLAFGTARPQPTGPARLRFRYLAERDADKPAPRPVESWPSGPTLPAAVIVEAVDAASTRLLLSDRIALRADGDIGCADRRPPQRRDASRPGQAPAAPEATSSTDPLGGPAPGQAAMTVPGTTTPLPPAAAAPSSGVTQTAANKNEFCGRLDKGVSQSASAAGAGDAIGGPGYAGTPSGGAR